MGRSDDSIAPMVTPESAARELRENTTDGAAVLARRAISLLTSVGEDAFEAVENLLVTAFLSDRAPCVSLSPWR